MANFEKIFEDFFDSVSSQSASVVVAKSASMKAMDSHPAMESFQSLPAGPQEEFLLQSQIRPVFGKSGCSGQVNPDTFLPLIEQNEPVALTRQNLFAQ